MHFVAIEYQIELAHVLEAVVEDLHKYLDQVQDRQLTFTLVNDEDEEERRILAIDDLGARSKQSVTIQEIVESSAGVDGWADSDPQSWVKVGDEVLPVAFTPQYAPPEVFTYFSKATTQGGIGARIY